MVYEEIKKQEQITRCPECGKWTQGHWDNVHGSVQFLNFCGFGLCPRFMQKFIIKCEYI